MREQEAIESALPSQLEGVARGAGTNPLEDLIRAELATATLAQLDHQAARLWKEHAAGRLDDEAIGRLSEEIHALKAGRRSQRPPATVSLGDAVKAHQAVLAGQAAPSAATKPAWARSIFPPKKPSQRSPDRAKSRERARTLAASSGLPPTIACQFTSSEQSVLFIVAAECYARGLCDCCHDELAARAGVSVSTVKRALRQAKHLDLVLIEERPQKGAKNLPNVVRIISREWAAWIGKRKPTGGTAIGGQKRPATEREDSRRGCSREQRPMPGPRRPVEPQHQLGGNPASRGGTGANGQRRGPQAYVAGLGRHP